MRRKPQKLKRTGKAGPVPPLMKLLAVVFLVLFIGLYLLLAQFFKIDVLFHRISDNDLAAGLIGAAGAAILLAYMAVIWRRGRRRPWLHCLVAGSLLLALQIGAQEFARISSAERLEAHAAAVKSAIEISDISDAPLLDETGRPIGISLSFTLLSALDAELFLLPLLMPLDDAGNRGGLVFANIAVRRVPPLTAPSPNYLADKSYRLSFDLVPRLLAWDPKTGRLCIRAAKAQRDAWIEAARASLPPGLQRFGLEISGTRFRGELQDRYEPRAMLEASLRKSLELCEPQGYLLDEALYYPAP